MARPNKQGLEYFPIDVSLESDDKLQMIIAEYEMKGEFIFIKLLSYIYKNVGYFCNWNEEITQLKFANSVSYALGGSQVNLIKEVVSKLIRWEIFDNLVFDRFGVLTSRRIQDTWIEATRKRKDRRIFTYLCLLDDKRPDDVVYSTFEAEETPKKTEVINKVNKTKLNQTKLKETKLKEDVSCGKPPDFISQIIQIFADEFERTREIAYFSNGVDRDAAGSLLQNYKKGNPSKTSEETLQDFRVFFSQCCEIQDKWHYDNMELKHINSQFNKIRLITNGKQHKPNNTKQPGVVDTGKEWIV